MTCISLIGMPAVGKSTVGVLLAKALGYDFMDTDLLIQVKAQRTLSQILTQDGFLALREIEADVIATVQCSRTVIATGGSAVYAESGMAHLRNLGPAAYLRASVNVLQQRIGDLEARGVAAEANATLDSILAERIPLYEECADLTVDADQSIQTVLTNLLRALSIHTGSA